MTVFISISSLNAFGEERLDTTELSVDESRAALKLLSERAAENFSKVFLIQAEYSLEDKYQVRPEMLKAAKIDLPQEPGPWTRHDIGTASLRYSAGEQSVFADVSVLESALIADVNGEAIEFPLPMPAAQRTVLTQTHYYYLRYKDHYADFPEVPALTGQVGRVAFREPLEEAARFQNATTIDVRHLFGYGGRLWSEHLDAIRNLLELESRGELKKPQGASERIINVRSIGSGESHVYRVAFTMWKSIEGTGSGAMQFVLRFPRSDGYMCTSTAAINSDGNDVELCYWQAKQMSGVAFPEKVIRTVLDPRSHRVTTSRAFVLKSALLNEECDSTQITLAMLGLENGERVLDRVEETCFRYRDGELVDPVSFHSPAVSQNPVDSERVSPEVRSHVAFVIVANVIVLACVIGVWWWWRLIRRQ